MLLPDPSCLQLESYAADKQHITMVVKTTPAAASCPTCRQPSRRIHSRYQRTLADLPWQGMQVRLQLHSRKFFCWELGCPVTIFTERFPAVAAPYGRRTGRLSQLMLQLGLALGGAGGARLAWRLGLKVSRDTLLRQVRSAPERDLPRPRILGVDEWAWKRGRRYGTLLCDLERRRVVDLLPDRDAESLARWLQQHPGVEVISRDRAAAYAEGARRGAPQAVQVADRWHLLRNLREALQRVVEREPAALRRAAETVASAQADSVLLAAGGDRPAAVEAPQQPTRAEQVQQQRRHRRLARYREAEKLRQQGFSQVAIACKLGLNPRTLRRWWRVGHFPERCHSPQKRRLLDGFVPYLQQRWASGCHNALQLWREIRQQGFTGSAGLVRLWAAPRRAGTPAKLPPTKQTSIVPTPRQMTWWLLGEPADLEPQQRCLLEAFERWSPAVKIASERARAFCRLLRQRDSEALSGWFEQVEGTELSGFAAGLRRDEAAVRAALRLPWSNGPVEGQVHRLKLVKRQMYGRANFDLLRTRVLQAA